MNTFSIPLRRVKKIDLKRTRISRHHKAETEIIGDIFAVISLHIIILFTIYLSYRSFIKFNMCMKENDSDASDVLELFEIPAITNKLKF